MRPYVRQKAIHYQNIITAPTCVDKLTQENKFDKIWDIFPKFFFYAFNGVSPVSELWFANLDESKNMGLTWK